MNKRILAFCLVIFSVSAILSSCGTALEQTGALVTMDGKAAGVVLKYTSRIDKESVTLDTYEVEGGVVGHFFVSDSNPFRGDSGTPGKGGRYVIILLKEQAPETETADDTPVVIDITDGIPQVTAKVRQVAPIKTVDGKTIRAWRKPVETVDRYPVEGGLMR